MNRLERPYRRPTPRTTLSVRATPTRGGGEGMDAAGARAHTHAKGEPRGPEG